MNQGVVSDAELFDVNVLQHSVAEKSNQTLWASGLFDEVRMLREKYQLSSDLPAMRYVGCRQTWEYFEGEIDLTTCRD